MFLSYIIVTSRVIHVYTVSTEKALDPTANLTFDLTLSERAKEERSRLVLPYHHSAEKRTALLQVWWAGHYSRPHPQATCVSCCNAGRPHPLCRPALVRYSTNQMKQMTTMTRTQTMTSTFDLCTHTTGPPQPPLLIGWLSDVR